MRREFIQVRGHRQASKAAPWAAVIVKVDGGYMAFESRADWQTWKKQK